MISINHPELRQGETLLMNVTESEFQQWSQDTTLMKMEYLRLGEQAYKTNSLNPVDPTLNFHPMFGKRKPR